MNARSLEIEITGKCLYKCRHCYGAFPQQGELSVETIRGILHEAKDFFDCIIFSGGEPFLHPGLTQLVLEGAQHFLIFITTSGFPVSDEQLLKIKNKAVLVFGIDGIGETHDAYRGYPGAFQNILKTMDKARTVPKEIIVTLWRGVIPHIDEIIQLAASYNAIVHFNHLIPVGRVRNNPDIIPDIEELDMVYEKLYHLKLQGGTVVTDLQKITEKDRETGIDIFCRGRFNITQQGNVRPCEFHSAILGNIYTESLREIILRAQKTAMIQSRERGFKGHIIQNLKNPYDYHTTICHTLSCSFQIVR